MKIISKLTIKYILKNKIRTLLALLGIIISIELIASLGNVIISTRSISTNGSILVDGEYDFKIKNSNKNIEKEIRKVNRIKDYYKIKSTNTVKIMNRNSNLSLDYYLGFDLVEADNKFYESYYKPGFLVEGEMPKNSDEILVPYDMKHIYPGFQSIGNIVELGISKSVSDDNIGYLGEHFSINELRKIQGKDLLEDFSIALSKTDYGDDSIYDVYSLKKEDFNTIVNNFDTRKKFKVVGYHSEASLETTYSPLYYSRYTKNNLNIITPINDVVFQGDIFTYNKNIDGDYNIYGIFDNYSNINSVSNEIKSNLKYYTTDIEINYPLISLKNFTFLRYGDIISYAISALSILVVLAVIYFIYNIFSLNFTKRVKDFSVLKIIGMTNSQLRKMLLIESLFYFLLSVPFAYFFSNIIMNFVYGHINRIIIESSVISNFNMEIDKNNTIFWIMSVVGLLSIFIANMLSSINVFNKTPLYSFKNNKREKNKNISKKIKFYPSNNFLYALRNIKNNMKRFNKRSAIIGVGLTLFLIISQFWLLLNDNSINYNSKNKTNLRLETDYKLSKNLESDLRKVNGLEIKYRVSNRNAYLFIESVNKDLGFNYDENNWTIMTYDDETFNKLFNEDIIYLSMYDDNGKNLTSIFDEKLNNKEYTNIFPIKSFPEDENSKVVEKDIHNRIYERVKYIDAKKIIYDVYFEDSNIMVMSEKKYKEINNKFNLDIESSKIGFGINRYNYDKKTGYEINSIISKYPSTYQNFVPFQEYRIAKILISAFLVVICAISIVNIINTTYTNVLTRRKEIGLKLSVGIGKNKLKNIYVIENVISIFISSIISLILSTIITLLTYIIIEKNFQIQLTEIMYKSWGKSLSIWLISTIIILIIIYYSIIIPYNNITKNNIINTLDEN